MCPGIATNPIFSPSLAQGQLFSRVLLRAFSSHFYHFGQQAQGLFAFRTAKRRHKAKNTRGFYLGHINLAQHANELGYLGLQVGVGKALQLADQKAEAFTSLCNVLRAHGAQHSTASVFDSRHFCKHAVPFPLAHFFNDVRKRWPN